MLSGPYKRFVPSGMLVVTQVQDANGDGKGSIGEVLTIKGHNLERIKDALFSYKLKMIRPANKGENIEDGKPRPTEIIIDDGE